VAISVRASAVAGRTEPVEGLAIPVFGRPVPVDGLPGPVDGRFEKRAPLLSEGEDEMSRPPDEDSCWPSALAPILVPDALQAMPPETQR